MRTELSCRDDRRLTFVIFAWTHVKDFNMEQTEVYWVKDDEALIAFLCQHDPDHGALDYIKDPPPGLLDQELYDYKYGCQKTVNGIIFSPAKRYVWSDLEDAEVYLNVHKHLPPVLHEHVDVQVHTTLLKKDAFSEDLTRMLIEEGIMELLKIPTILIE